MKVELKPGMGLGTLQLLIEETAEGRAHWDPTFIIDCPAEIQPAGTPAATTIRRSPDALSCSSSTRNRQRLLELNDPEVQAERFQAQSQGQGCR